MTPAPASAGAWIAPVDGQEIWTSLVGQRDELYFYEGSTYWETPADEDTSAVFSTWVEQNYETEDGWRGEAVVGAKQTLFRDDEIIVAAQAGLLWSSHPSADCGEGGVEARFLGGMSYREGGFLNVEIAARALEGGCGGERIDVTAGTRFAGNWLAMGQVFVDSPHEGEETVKAQISLVRFGDEGRGVQVGLRARIDDGVQEPALVIGFWGPAND